MQTARDTAVRAAADAARAHKQAPDTVTLRDLHAKVQAALDQGAGLQDIAAANHDR